MGNKNTVTLIKSMIAPVLLALFDFELF